LGEGERKKRRKGGEEIEFSLLFSGKRKRSGKRGKGGKRRRKEGHFLNEIHFLPTAFFRKGEKKASTGGGKKGKKGALDNCAFNRFSTAQSKGRKKRTQKGKKGERGGEKEGSLPILSPYSLKLVKRGKKKKVRERKKGREKGKGGEITTAPY